MFCPVDMQIIFCLVECITQKLHFRLSWTPMLHSQMLFEQILIILLVPSLISKSSKIFDIHFFLYLPENHDFAFLNIAL